MTGRPRATDRKILLSRRLKNEKGGRSRPFIQNISNPLLFHYLRRRQAFFAQSISPYVFVSSTGNRLDQAHVHRTFYALSRQIGLRGPHASHGPRIHDLRHRFAVRVLTHWYQAGEDAARLLPVLSAYIGHVRVQDTYWYLSAWPELMAQAMSRLERRWEVAP